MDYSEYLKLKKDIENEYKRNLGALELVWKRSQNLLSTSGEKQSGYIDSSKTEQNLAEAIRLVISQINKDFNASDVEQGLMDHNYNDGKQINRVSLTTTLHRLLGVEKSGLFKREEAGFLQPIRKRLQMSPKPLLRGVSIMENNLVNPENSSAFEKIRKSNEEGFDYWSSRDLAKVLDYSNYTNFEGVIKKAIQACFNSGHDVKDHFVDINEMVGIGSGAKRPIKSVNLSRYACYLIIQNADPSKKIIATGQTYFAAQTRRQELHDEEKETEQRLALREELKTHNISLAGTAKGAGVIIAKDYAIFQNHGYKGLYGGLNAQNIHKKKGLKKSQHILDHMGSTELAANLFRATQTEDKIRRNQIKGKDNANRTHYEIGQKVRKTIEDIGGTPPEELPAAENLKKIGGKSKNRLTKRNKI